MSSLKSHLQTKLNELKAAWTALGPQLRRGLRSRWMALAIGIVCFGFALVLFPMKIAQVEREGILFARHEAAKDPSKATIQKFDEDVRRTYRRDGEVVDEDGHEKWAFAAFRGVSRRLDDPSFWFIVAMALAAFAAARAFARNPTAEVDARVTRSDLIRAVILFLLILIGYLTSCWCKAEAFFWPYWKPDDDHRHADYFICKLQLYEGIICVSAIALGVWLFTIARALHRAGSQGRGGGGDGGGNAPGANPAPFDALSLLLTVGMAPLTVFGFAFSLMAILDITDADKIYGPFGLLSKFMLPLMGMPFIALYLEVAAECERRNLRIQTCNLLEIGAMSQFAVIISTLGAALAFQWFEVDNGGPPFKMNRVDRGFLWIFKLFRIV